MAAEPDANVDKRARIGLGYDAIADKYLKFVEKVPSHRIEYLNKMLAKASKNGQFLDAGCGAGIPVLQKLVAHANGLTDHVTGADISQGQINLARIHCPEAHLIHSDMLNLSFENDSFDGIASFCAIFHMHRDQQPAFIRQLYDWIKPGGYFVGNLGADSGREVHEDFFGERMYWSSFDVERNKAMFEDAGFVLENASVRKEEGLKSSDSDYDVKFLWLLAHKPK